jgi:hypothetical protein
MVVVDSIHQDGKLIGFAKITGDMTEQRVAQLAEARWCGRPSSRLRTDMPKFMLDKTNYRA